MSAGTGVALGVAEAVARDVLEWIEDACERVEIAGSIRRGEARVKDIEVVAIPRFSPGPAQGHLFGGPEKVSQVNHLWMRLGEMSEEGLIEVRKSGPKYWQVSLCEPYSIVVDIYTTDADAWGWTLFYRTGPAEWNPLVLGRLKRRGLGGSRGGRLVNRSEVPVETPCEEDVFKAADLPYIRPYSRCPEAFNEAVRERIAERAAERVA